MPVRDIDAESDQARAARTRVNELYVVLLEDLNAGQRLSQTAHVVGAFAVKDVSTTRTWTFDGSVKVVTAKAGDLEIMLMGATAHFCEQDLQGALTALVFYNPNEHAKRILRRLPLAS